MSRENGWRGGTMLRSTSSMQWQKHIVSCRYVYVCAGIGMRAVHPFPYDTTHPNPMEHLHKRAQQAQQSKSNQSINSNISLSILFQSFSPTALHNT